MYLDVHNASLWFEDHLARGKQRGALVFVHAATGSSEGWRGQLPYFTEAGYRCVVYDQRGSRNSPAASHIVDAADLVSDLASLTLELGVGKHIIVAAAMGGFVALEHATRNPQELAGLVVANSMGGLADPRYQALLGTTWSPEILELPGHVLELSATYRATTPLGVQDWLQVHLAARQTPPSSYTFEHRNTAAGLAQIGIPTLFIAGDEDLLSPPQIMGILASHVPGSQLTVIPQTGHSSYWEKPDEFNRSVDAFARSIFEVH
ncbi:alpha/beta fold hydrolase [Microbacterium sp. BR1]|uniref:alpha/beta fold hydrolase n=1 Tax=Microbacterium sp. BR1 TaxID=1070896 RepID=UPI000C2CB8BB|nr:alpha/beta hydrolase [Microbacterium sp. BR1]